MTRCPKCGGSGGFEGVLVMRYHMTGAWGQPWETSGSDKVVYRSLSVRCSDCGHRVPAEVAEGYKPANDKAKPARRAGSA